MKKGSKIN